MRGLAEIVRLRTGECRDAAEVIAQLAAGDTEVDEVVAGHVAQCLRCQAEVAAYRRILGAMRSMRDDAIAPPAGAVAAVLAALEAANGTSGNWAVRAAYFGGITVATAAAGAAGVLVWINRRRGPLAEAG